MSRVGRLYVALTMLSGTFRLLDGLRPFRQLRLLGYCMALLKSVVVGYRFAMFFLNTELR